MLMRLLLSENLLAILCYNVERYRNIRVDWIDRKLSTKERVENEP